VHRARQPIALALVGLASLALGCRALPARARSSASTALSAALDYGPGSLVGGQHAGVSSTSASRPTSAPASRPAAVALRCSAWWLERAPRESTEPLTSHARLVLAPLAAEPFRVLSSLAPDARHADAAASARWLSTEAAPADGEPSARELGRFDLVLLPDQIARIELREPRERAVFAALELALVESGEPRAMLELVRPRPGTSPARERLLLERLFAPEEARCALFAPLELDDTPGWGFAFALEGGLALDEGQARAAERIARAAAKTPRVARADEDPSERAASALRAAALEGLASPSQRRHALLALADQAQAPFARELARSAERELLASWAERVQALRAEELTPAELAWEFERSAWRTALEHGVASDPARDAGAGTAGAASPAARSRGAEARGAAGANAPGRDLSGGGRSARAAADAPSAEQPASDQAAAALGLLLRHAGEAARVEGLLADLLDSCSELAELHARLLEENLYALEDSSPAARVRAYDWLGLRGMQPPGYDPLAGRDARREALLAAERAERAAELGAFESADDASSRPAPTSAPAASQSTEREP